MLIYIHQFTERTPSSFVEEREASVVWRYWTGPNSTADRAWARRQAAEAQNHIFDSIGERFGLRIMPGTNSFLVLPNNVSRANAVSALLHPSGPVRSPMMGTGVWATPSVGMGEGTDGENVFDFVLAISADERLLRRLNDLEAAETCSTGTRGSDAKWRLDVKEVMGTLSQFAGAA